MMGSAMGPMATPWSGSFGYPVQNYYGGAVGGGMPYAGGVAMPNMGMQPPNYFGNPYYGGPGYPFAGFGASPDAQRYVAQNPPPGAQTAKAAA